MAGGRSASNSPVRVARRARSRSPLPQKRLRSRSPRSRGGNNGPRNVRGKECRVFVTNLPYEARWMELKDLMKKEGKVAHVEVLSDDMGKSRGIGIVEFTSPEEARHAIEELDGVDFQGRKLRLREDKMDDDRYADQLRMQKERSRNQAAANRNSGGGRSSQQSPSLDGLLGGGGGLQQLIQLLGNKRSSGSNSGSLNQLASLLSGGNQMQSQSGSSALSALAGLGALGGGLGGLLSGSLGPSNPSSDRGSYRGGDSFRGNDNFRGNDSYGNREPNRREGGNFNPNRLGRSGGGNRNNERGAPPGCGVFVRNLPFSARWQDLKDKFKQAGRVTRADIKMDEDGRSKGWGTVAFEVPEDASRAVSLFDGQRMDGRELEVRLDRMN